MAHECGHNLNFRHDFIDPYTNPKNYRYDSNGNPCTNIGGVMDYYVTVTRWTSCSYEALTNYVNSGSFCMTPNA